AEPLGDRVGVQLAVIRKPALAVGVPLAGDTGAARQVVECASELRLDEVSLLFDDHDLVEPLGELSDDLRIQGIDHADLEEPDTELSQLHVAQPQVVERLPDVGVGLAGGHDAETVAATALDYGVQLVGARVSEGGRESLLVQVAFQVDRAWREEDEALGLLETVKLRDHDARPVRTEYDGLSSVAEVGDALEAHPGAGQPRERNAVQAQLEELGNGGRKEHRHAAGDEVPLAVVRQSGAFCLWVVGCQRQHRRVPGTAAQVCVLEDVKAAVDSGTLAIPDADHAVVAGAEDLGHLAAPDVGRGELLVEARDEADPELVQVTPRLHQGEVITAQRRARIAADEDPGFETGATLAPHLPDRQPAQRLDAGHEGGPLDERVLVVERDRWPCVPHPLIVTPLLSASGGRLGTPHQYGCGVLRGPEPPICTGGGVLGAAEPRVVRTRSSGGPRPPPAESQEVRWFAWPEALALADEGLAGALRKLAGLM